MTRPISNLDVLLASMEPELQPGVYVFASVPLDASLEGIAAIGDFPREGRADGDRRGRRGEQGRTDPAISRRLDYADGSLRPERGRPDCRLRPRAWRANISCNVVAAALHDHIFVPVDDAGRAMAALRRFSNGRSRGRTTIHCRRVTGMLAAFQSHPEHQPDRWHTQDKALALKKNEMVRGRPCWSRPAHCSCSPRASTTPAPGRGSRPSRKPRWSARWPTGSRSSRCSAIRSGADPAHGHPAGEQGACCR